MVERKFMDLESKLNDDFYVEESKLKHELRALETALEEANAEVEETALATSNTGLQMQVSTIGTNRHPFTTHFWPARLGFRILRKRLAHCLLFLKQQIEQTSQGHACWI